LLVQGWRASGVSEWSALQTGTTAALGRRTTSVDTDNCHNHTLVSHITTTTTTTTILRPFFRDHPGEPVPEENFWTLWYKGRLTEADTPTIRLGATPTGLTRAHLHHPHIFYKLDALPAAQPCQSTEGTLQTNTATILRSGLKPGTAQRNHAQ